MIPDSFLARNLVYAAALLQTAVAPLAFVAVVYSLIKDRLLFQLHPTLDAWLHYWLGSELIFYLFFQVTRNRMQRLLPSVAPSPKERRELYEQCLANIDDATTWLPGWFMKGQDPTCHPAFDEVCRDNVAEWLAWAFFAQPVEVVLENESDTAELHWMIDTFERHYNVSLQEGYDDSITAFRINLDPVNAYHRPLVFYVVIQTMNSLFGLVLQWWWGFEFHGPEARSTLWNLVDARVPPTTQHHLSYWYRNGHAQRKPIVFVHGVGAGLACYAYFIHTLMSLDAPVFLLELPFVSMRCVDEVPTMQETLHDVENMLNRHGFQDAVIVAHSLGTAVASWAIKHIPHRVAGAVFLDPICFMLHYKDICVNFVYRVPQTASQAMVKYFASSELYISHYISRHFHWFQNALYITPRTFQPRKALRVARPLPRLTKVFLSEHDNIVNSARVDAYLEKYGYDSQVMTGLDHASLLFHTAWQKQILDTVDKFTSVCT